MIKKMYFFFSQPLLAWNAWIVLEATYCPTIYSIFFLWRHCRMCLRFSFVYCLCWQSMGFIHRTSSIVHRNPFRNIFWSIVAVFIVLAQSTFSLLTIGYPWSSPFLMTTILLWPVVILISDEIVKHHDRVIFRRQQQRLRIVFDTKLGMHSPK
jgi:hypothetical protein